MRWLIMTEGMCVACSDFYSEAMCFKILHFLYVFLNVGGTGLWMRIWDIILLRMKAKETLG